MKRRSFLKALPFATGMVALPAVAIANAPEPEMTAEERREFHLAEYKRACEELDPTIDRWSEVERGAEVKLTAYKVTGRYVGDGFYDCRQPSGCRVVNLVQLMPKTKVDGHRAFQLTPWPGLGTPTAILDERALQSTIGKFLS